MPDASRVSAMDCGCVEKIQDQDKLSLSHSLAPKMAVSSTLGFKVALWKYALLFLLLFSESMMKYCHLS